MLEMIVERNSRRGGEGGEDGVLSIAIRRGGTYRNEDRRLQEQFVNLDRE